ncbi:MAG: hypothetical protein ACWIPH_10565, partial [Ostreibacterium sp.]
MNNKHLLTAILSTTLFLGSCTNNQQSNQLKKNINQPLNSHINKTDFIKQSVNDELAEKIKHYLNTQYLSKFDLAQISELKLAMFPESDPREKGIERQFQLYQVDLNNDGMNEVFIMLNGPYFCGTGGCNVLLLNNQQKLITNFTVVRRPILVAHSSKNGWRALLAKSKGKLKVLTYNHKKYPSNPSVVKQLANDQQIK